MSDKQIVGPSGQPMGESQKPQIPKYDCTRCDKKGVLCIIGAEGTMVCVSEDGKDDCATELEKRLHNAEQRITILARQGNSCVKAIDQMVPIVQRLDKGNVRDQMRKLNGR